MWRGSQTDASQVGILGRDGKMRTIATMILLSALASSPAAAQATGGTPASFGGDVGLFAPFEGGSSTSFTGRVTADLYWWRPLGIRFAAGFANPTLGDKPNDARVGIGYVTASAIRPFKEGSFRPYGHAGVGLYHLSGNSSGTQLGLTFGGGVELFTGWRRTLLTPELTAHVVSGGGPRFSLALTVGLHTRPE
jgi:hypothetical protein